MQTIEILNTFDVTALEDILIMDRYSYPIGWAYPDAEDYYGEMLLKEEYSYLLKGQWK